MKGELKKGIEGMAWLSISSTTNIIINFILTIILARLLSAEDYGIYHAIAILIGFADMLWQMGICPAIVQRKDISREDIDTGNTLNISMGFLLFCVINMFAGYWGRLFGIANLRMLHLYSVIFITNTIMAVPKAVLQKECKFDKLAKGTILSSIIHAVTAIAFSLMNMGAWALVLSVVIQYVVQFIYVWWVTRFRVKFIIKKNSIKKLFSFGAGYTLGSIFNYIALQADNYIINITLGSRALGYYGKAYNLIGYPANLVGQTMSSVLFPMMSKNQDKDNYLRKTFQIGSGAIGLMLAPIFAITYVCREELVVFLLGRDWLEVAVPFGILVLGLYFRTAYKLNYTLMNSKGKVYLGSLTQFVYALSICLGAYIGHYKGLSGVALGVTIAFTINYIITVIIALNIAGMKIRQMCSYWIPIIIYTIIVWAFAYFIRNGMIGLVGNRPFIILVCVTLTTCLSYLLIYIITYKIIVPNELSEIIKDAILLLRNKVQKKSK